MDKVKAKLARTLAKFKAKVAAVCAKSKAVGMSLAVAASLTLPAFASGNGGGDSSGLTSVTSAADTVTTFVSKAFTMMTGNPLLCVYLASSLIGVGIYKFVQLRRAAH